MGRKATKPQTIFLNEVVEILSEKGIDAKKFNGGGTSPNGIVLRFQQPHMSILTTLVIGIYGVERNDGWFCSNLRYQYSNTHQRYHIAFSEMMPQKFCDFIIQEFLHGQYNGTISQ